MKKKNLADYLVKPIVPTIMLTASFLVLLGVVFAWLLPAISGIPFLGQLFSNISFEIALPTFLGLLLSMYFFNVVFSLVTLKTKDIWSALGFSAIKGIVFTALLIPVAWLAGVLSGVIPIQVISISTVSWIAISSTILTFALAFFAYELLVHYAVPQFLGAKAKKHFMVTAEA